MVSLEGPAPQMTEVANESCHAGAPKLKQETVIVGATGGLANALVYLEGAPRSATTRPAPVLDQVDCRYVPHLLGIVAGQSLVVRSSDAGTMHNVHLTASVNAAQNFGMTAAGQTRNLKLDRAEHDPPIRVKCDVHPWMTAYVAVMDNPYFAVTGDDGTFELPGLPPGSYKLVAWHELYGRREQAVTVSDDGKVAEATFVYKSQ
jgi:hypothetical protein